MNSVHLFFDYLGLIKGTCIIFPETVENFKKKFCF